MASAMHMLYNLISLVLRRVFVNFRQIFDRLTYILPLCANFRGRSLSEQQPDVEKNANSEFDTTPERTPNSRTNLVEWTLYSGSENLDVPLLIDVASPERFVTKREARRLVASLAGAFEPDTTICLHLPNDVLYPVLVLAILASNCRWTGTNIAYTSHELEHHFRISDTKYVITLPEHVDIVMAASKNLEREIDMIRFTEILGASASIRGCYNGARLPEHDLSSNIGDSTIPLRTLHDLLNDCKESSLENKIRSIDPDQTAILQSTSGTTGMPKMAARSHRALILESVAIEDNNQQKPYEVRRLFCTPIFHAFSFPEMVITALRLGIPIYFMRRFDQTFAQKVFDFEITEIAAPPPMLKLLHERTEHHHLLQSLRTIFSGGAPLAPELRKRVLSMFTKPPRIVQVWGMTEGGWFTTFKYPEDDSTGAVGRLVPGLEIKVSTNTDVKVSNSTKAGELLVRGPQLMTEYYGNDKASQQAFEDGWLRTGDIGYIQNGKVYIIDRCKDLIKVNGFQVAPAEIEAAVLSLSGVDDAAAIAVGSGVEEHPLLFVVSSHSGDVSNEVLLNHLRGRMARHKVAHTVIEFIDRIPRNASGKVLRKVLRKVARKEGSMGRNCREMSSEIPDVGPCAIPS